MQTGALQFCGVLLLVVVPVLGQPGTGGNQDSGGLSRDGVVALVVGLVLGIPLMSAFIYCLYTIRNEGWFRGNRLGDDHPSSQKHGKNFDQSLLYRSSRHNLNAENATNVELQSLVGVPPSPKGDTTNTTATASASALVRPSALITSSSSGGGALSPSHSPLVSSLSGGGLSPSSGGGGASGFVPRSALAGTHSKKSFRISYAEGPAVGQNVLSADTDMQVEDMKVWDEDEPASATPGDADESKPDLAKVKTAPTIKYTSPDLDDLTTGSMWHMYTMVRGGTPVCRPVQLFYEFHAESGAADRAGCLYWCEPGKRDKHRKACLQLTSIVDIFYGKATDVTSNRALSNIPDYLFLTIASKMNSLHLCIADVNTPREEANAIRQRLVKAITFAMNKYRREHGFHRKRMDDELRFTYDMVMVFKLGNATKKVTLQLVEEDPVNPNKKTKRHIEMTEQEFFKKQIGDTVLKLEKAGLETDLWYSQQKDEVYCRLGATESRLELDADQADVDLQLDALKCAKKGHEMGVVLAQRTGKVFGQDVWLNIHGKYDRWNHEFPWRQDLYKRYNNDKSMVNHPRYNTLFNDINRLKITAAIIRNDEKLGGAELAVSKLIKNPRHPLVAFFPLHKPSTQKLIYNRFMNWLVAFKAPLEELREYFGESVAIYFAYLGFYNKCLLMPAVIGLAFFIYQMAAGRVDPEGIPGFAIFIALWATLFLEFWKRREAKYRVRWGMTHFLEKEQPRTEYKGQWQPSPVTGKLEEIFPWSEKIFRLLLSQSVIGTMIGCVLACVVGIFLLRQYLYRTNKELVPITAVLNAIQIQILNQIYGRVGVALTEFENHRTETSYSNSLIAKSFLFKFVNCYNSLFYIAFFKENDAGVGGCVQFKTKFPGYEEEQPDCLKELTLQLGIIMGTAIFVSNFVELFVPWLKGKIMAKQNTDKDAQYDKSRPEIEFEFAPYDSTFDDFDELVIQFGYVTLFVVAFPLAPLIALVSNIVEMRIDGTKLLLLTRRPEPRGAANIGTWFDILQTVSFIAIGTNVAIIAFSSHIAREWFSSGATRAYFFLIVEHAILAIKFAMMYFVPDEPQDVKIHILRQEFIVSILLNGMEDWDDPVPPEADDEFTVTSSGEHQYNWDSIPDQIRSSGHEMMVRPMGLHKR